MKTAVGNVETYLKKKGGSLQAKAPYALLLGYQPEPNITPDLESTGRSFDHSLVGILRWTVELGRAGLSTKISMQSSHLALPCEVHLKKFIISLLT